MIDVDNNHITYAIDNKKRLTLTVYKYLSDERNYIDEIVGLYLKQTDLEHLTDRLTYCIHELAANACRANTKRTYFKHNNLDIDDSKHYELGMKSFRDTAFSDMEKYHNSTREYGFYIKFQIKKNGNSIDLSVLNNVALTLEEEMRIRDKFEQIKDFDNVAEAFSVLADSSEGAGLGIAMMIMMLKEMGLDADRLKIFRVKNETHAVISLPIILVSA